jgi:hypothetical protein
MNSLKEQAMKATHAQNTRNRRQSTSVTVTEVTVTGTTITDPILSDITSSDGPQGLSIFTWWVFLCE